MKTTSRSISSLFIGRSYFRLAQNAKTVIWIADDRIVLAHGGGGRLTHQLIEKIFMPAFGNPMLEQGRDGAVLPVNGSLLAFTTDSFVVRPLIFPGGTIGDLAVYGTVNDLAMCGPRPLY